MLTGEIAVSNFSCVDANPDGWHAELPSDGMVPNFPFL